MQPGVILDGAHNPDKMKALLDFVSKFEIRNENFSNENPKYETGSTRGVEKGDSVLTLRVGVTLVLAFKKGKDWKKMVDLLMKSLPVEEVIATKFNAVTDTGAFAAVPAEEIGQYLESRVKSRVIKNSQEAVWEALNSKFLIPNSPVIVTGSLYLVGEVRAMWFESSF